MRVPLTAVLRSEWTKLRTLRSTWWCTAVYVLVVGSFAWLAAATTRSAPTADSAVGVVLTGFAFGQVVLVVLGVLAVTSEFGGMALSSLVAVPRRTRLLAAKTAVVTAWAAVVTVLLVAGCVLAARTLVAVPGGVSPGDPEVLRAAGLQVAGAVLVTVLAAGLGAVLRSTAGALGLGIALVFVGPPALAIAGGRTAELLSQALPSLRVGEDSFLAVPTTWPVGLAVAGAWAAGAWAAGAVLLERRDV
ncbi:ABC transporter permease [Geodermatophilus nigrescens]|uniref:ABC-2 family transporter protein n=1 Tax=Geodermatophilus nigrescens TaxID=1070870 RepID=A0A1M5EKW6_9ACTN|nr:ABC transporter permease [Geodermatophilus nigrescens]SHF79855.1 ABC-2 family transporter protein [Geodermatophilus nigrescens]